MENEKKNIRRTMQRCHISVIGIPEDHKGQKQYSKKYMLKLRNRKSSHIFVRLRGKQARKPTPKHITVKLLTQPTEYVFKEDREKKTMIQKEQ